MENSFKVNINDYHQRFDQNAAISYKGPIDEQILQVIGSYIGGMLSKSPKVARKIFKIFIELAQNISYYSAERNWLSGKEIGSGMVVIKETDKHHTFLTGNIVQNEDIFTIIDKCEIVNSLNREELREYKRMQRSLPAGKKGGAHIGLIQVALTAANPLDIEITPVDDNYSFFSIIVKINK